MEDWQETAFNNRRLPHGRSGKRKGGAFDARKTFGTYELKGAAVDRANALSSSSSGDVRSIVTIHSLTDGGDGLVGTVEIPGAMKGMILLAGSRRVLLRTVREAESSGEPENDGDGRQVEGSRDGEDGDSDDNDNAGGEELEPDEPGVFEKNTFRSPKFWAQWRALVNDQSANSNKSSGHTDTAYFVFTGNDCKLFKATINCPALNWKNVAVTGHRISSKPTDCPTDWTDVSLSNGDKF